MVEIREPGGSATLTGSSAVEAARACRPISRPDVATLATEGGQVVWPAEGGPSLILSLWAAVWPELDGSLSGDDLIEDLVAVLGCSVQQAEQEVTRFLLLLHDGGLVDGVEPLEAERDRIPRPTHASPTPRHYEHEVDGVRYAVTEIDISLDELHALAGGAASLAELAPADSCLGKRLHLHEDAVVRTVELDGQMLSVRSADAEQVAWLEGLPEHRPGEKGPIVAFVTAGAGGAGRTRWEVYDGGGSLAASTTQPPALRRAVAGLLSADRTSAPPDFVPVRLRAVVRGDRAVLAPLGLTERPRGTIRQLDRRGAAVLPAVEVHLASDGSEVWVPEPPIGGPFLGERTSGFFTLAGLWGMAAGAAEVGLAEAQAVSQLVRDSSPCSADARRTLMQAVLAAVRTVPMGQTGRGERSARGVANRLTELLA